MLQSGKMRQRVTLQRYIAVQDPTGDLTENWTDVGTFYADIQPLSGSELFYSGADVSKNPYKITMRNVASITSQDRLVYDGRTLNLESINRHDERNEYYEIMATEVKAQ